MKKRVLCWLWIAAVPFHGQTVGEGIAAIEAGRLDDAVRILSGEIQRNPNSSEGYFYLGLAHFRAGRSTQARPALERAAALAPGNAQAWKILGLAATSAGDPDAAVAALRTACELAPTDDEACYYFARNLFALGHYEAARTPFEKALRAAAQPQLTRVHRAIALNYVALNSPAGAEQHFIKAIQSAGRTPRGADDPRVDYGAFLFRQGRTADALRTLQPAAQETPASARANLELGRVMLHADRLAEAAACLEKAVQLEPENFNAHLLLGRAYLRLGKTSEGEREMRLGQEGWAGKK
jgi:tetratricopeptide (TPR) repeat protein